MPPLNFVLYRALSQDGCAKLAGCWMNRSLKFTWVYVSSIEGNYSCACAPIIMKSESNPDGSHARIGK